MPVMQGIPWDTLGHWDTLGYLGIPWETLGYLGSTELTKVSFVPIPTCSIEFLFPDSTLLPFKQKLKRK